MIGLTRLSEVRGKSKKLNKLYSTYSVEHRSF